MKADRIFALILVFLGIGYLVSMVMRWFKNQEIAPSPTAASDVGNSTVLSKPVTKVLQESEMYTFPANSVFGLDISSNGETTLKIGDGDTLTLNSQTYQVSQRTVKYSVDIQVKSIVGTTNLVYYV